MGLAAGRALGRRVFVGGRWRRVLAMRPRIGSGADCCLGHGRGFWAVGEPGRKRGPGSGPGRVVAWGAGACLGSEASRAGGEVPGRVRSGLFPGARAQVLGRRRAGPEERPRIGSGARRVLGQGRGLRAVGVGCEALGQVRRGRMARRDRREGQAPGDAARKSASDQTLAREARRKSIWTMRRVRLSSPTRRK